MKIVIHRGTHQIGGCATEYRTNKTRILVDFGAELDEHSQRLLDINGVTKGETDCDAVFFTHYHGDHIGLLDTINENIPLYMGTTAKEICRLLNDRLSSNPDIKSYDSGRINNIRTFEAGKSVLVGDIKITPFWVDHSAFDAYMFLIEADGQRVLHTGDFRNHGFRGKGLKQVLDKYITKTDALVCEGTTLNRNEKKNETEMDLSNRIEQVLKNNKYVFVVCSSTNIDRIAGFCSVVPKGKYCVCDKYQYSIIEYIRRVAGDKSPLYKFKKMLYFDKNLEHKMEEQGFCMFIRCGNPKHRRILSKFSHLKPIIIYSMWKGYLELDSVKTFLDGFERLDMHTSGHADSDTIKLVRETVKPDIIIPMHTEKPERFLDYVDKDRIVFAKDGECIDIGSIKNV